ncbi:MAG: histidine kinase [Leptothrix sp. (in: Bacteria)]|nr:histidine kinase [Leptothrix sp. (in: b-proteobacteria)]
MTAADSSPRLRARPEPADNAPPFEASAFDTLAEDDVPWRWVGWRRRVLALAVLLGCLLVFGLARWLAGAPQIDGGLAADAHGALLLATPPQPTLDARGGRRVVAIGAPGFEALPVDALLLHRWPRWQPDDNLRARQVAQHEALATRLAAPGARAQWHFADGNQAEAELRPRGYAGLGPLFWPLAAVAMTLFLCAVVLVLAQPGALNLLFGLMALCQAGNLLLVAVAGTEGPGLPAGFAAIDLPLRVALDLCTGAAAVNVFVFRPRPLPHAPLLAAAAWSTLPAWGLATAAAQGLPLWWLAQFLCLGLALSALATVHASHRLERNPQALVMQGLSAAALATLALVTAAAALAPRSPDSVTQIVRGAAVAWPLLLSSLLLLTPLLTRQRQLLREFALLAGASTVATSLDLLFVTVLSLSAFTSLALAVFIGIGLYAATRQWLLNHVIGSNVLTTERAFEQLYRAARAVQAQPRRFLQVLTELLRGLFEPLEVQLIERVPSRSRIVGGGAALLVPVREAGADAGRAPPASRALLLRFAQRGQRLFTLDDARLADRMVEQLRRAAAYDAAVERGRFEERQRIAQDLHDDIGARLLTLMYQAPTREMEDYIRHTLLDLKTLTRGLAASEHRFSHAAAEWKADITHRLTLAQVSLGWAFDIDHDRGLSVVQWSALTRVLRELVSNSLYHGHATHIDIGFRLQGPLLVLQVADDGQGRAPQDWSQGLGLGGVRKRVKLLGGEVAWRENGGCGIVCTVRVPDFAARA